MNERTQLGRRAVLSAVGAAFAWLASQSAAQTYTILHTFGSTNDGSAPTCLLLAGKNLYGATDLGGNHGKGTVFRINTDGGGYTVLKHFTGKDGGVHPQVALSDATLYGTLEYGGTNQSGAVFKLNVDGSGFGVLHTFMPGRSNGSNLTNAEGLSPYGGVIVLSNTIYGTTFTGGSYGYGTIFELNTDGSGFTVLKHFAGSDGSSPNSSLTIAGNTLYGATYNGGNNRNGTVFKINTDGTGYTNPYIFGGFGGVSPEGTLAVSGSTLFGTCYSGGASNSGTIYRVNADGTGFGVMHNFNSGEGQYPVAGLVLSGDILYGTTTGGGAMNQGGLFKINTDGSAFAVLKHFTGREGANARITLVAQDVTTLYGVTYAGGRLSSGVLFRFSLLPGLPQPDPFIDTQPESQTANMGDAVEFWVHAIGSVSPTNLLNYQWFKDDVALRDDPGISGANSSTLLLSNVTHDAVGSYWVAVSNLVGRATSQVATLTARDPFFVTQPFNQLAYYGRTIQCVAVAGGSAPLSWQWFKNGSALGDGVNISGAHTSVLTIAGVSESDAGVYSATISNAFGALTSSPAVLRVLSPPPPPGTLAVAEINAAGGSPGNTNALTVTFGLFDWDIMSLEFPIFDTLLIHAEDAGRICPINQAADPDFATLVSALSNGRADSFGYRVLAGGGYGSGGSEFGLFAPLPEGYSDTDFQGLPIDNISLLVDQVTLTHPQPNWTDYIFRGRILVNSEPWPPPAILVAPIAQTAEPGNLVALTVSASALQPVQYQWYFNGTAINGETNDTLHLPGVNASDVGLYSVVISNVLGAVTSAPVVLNVIPAVARRPVPGINVTAPTGSAVGVDYCDMLGPAASWRSLASWTPSTPSQLCFDVTEPLPAERFYRAWLAGIPAGIPSLQLTAMVPAISLTGNVGDRLRLDYVNRFGPTDAWVTLATVTLTNTTQLYFDTSSIGQPPRLWRIVPVP